MDEKQNRREAEKQALYLELVKYGPFGLLVRELMEKRPRHEALAILSDIERGTIIFAASIVMSAESTVIVGELLDGTVRTEVFAIQTMGVAEAARSAVH